MRHEGEFFRRTDEGERLINLPEQQKRQIPQSVVIAREKKDKRGYTSQYLACVGVKEHTNDPLNEIYEILDHEWAQFLFVTRGIPNKKKKVIYEGYKKSVPGYVENESTLLKQHGGMMLIAYWAQKEGIDAISGEPEPYSEAKEIIIDYPPEPIVLYYFMRLGPQMYRSGIRAHKDVRDYLQSRLNDMKDALNTCTPFKGFNFSYDYLAMLYHNEYNRKFTVKDMEFLRNETFIDHMLQHPGQDESRVSQVSRRVNEIRDNHFLHMHESLMRKGESVYSQIGLVHAENIKDGILQLGQESSSVRYNGFYDHVYI